MTFLYVKHRQQRLYENARMNRLKPLNFRICELRGPLCKGSNNKQVEFSHHNWRKSWLLVTSKETSIIGTYIRVDVFPIHLLTNLSTYRPTCLPIYLSIDSYEGFEPTTVREIHQQLSFHPDVDVALLHRLFQRLEVEDTIGTRTRPMEVA